MAKYLNKIRGSVCYGMVLEIRAERKTTTTRGRITPIGGYPGTTNETNDGSDPPPGT